MGNSEPNANPNPAAEQRKGSYKGNCDDLGRSSGQGFMKYADGSTFEGNFEEGLPENGTFLYPNGCKYVGHLRQAKPEGDGKWWDHLGCFEGQFIASKFVNGTVKYVDGSVFTGHMKNNRKHGTNCEFKYPDGDTFIGEFDMDQFKQGTFNSPTTGQTYTGAFLGGKKDGKGKLLIRGVLEYEGGFKEDLFDGQGSLHSLKHNWQYKGTFLKGEKSGRGKEIEANGNVYDGQFLNNQRTGKQCFYTFGTKTYQGQFLQGKFHGKGILKDGKGSCYEGEFIANRKHGQGVLILGRTNEHYEGEFKDDLMDGFGKITYANGDIYLGNFTKGKKNGKGKYTIKDRYELDGNWEMEVKHGDFVERQLGTRDVIEGEYINNQKHGQFTHLDGRVDNWEMGKLIYH